MGLLSSLILPSIYGNFVYLFTYLVKVTLCFGQETLEHVSTITATITYQELNDRLEKGKCLTQRLKASTG